MGEKACYEAVMHGGNRAPGYWARCENRYGGGWPDLVGLIGDQERGRITAFVEAKYKPKDEMPKLIGSKVDLDLRPDQALWLWRWWESGGMSFILARLDKEYLLIEGRYARDVAKGWTLEEMRERSTSCASAYKANTPFCGKVFEDAVRTSRNLRQLRDWV